MKTRITLIALLAALAIPATQAQYARKEVNTGEQKFRTTTQVVTPTTLKVTKVSKVKANIAPGMAKVTLTAGSLWTDNSGYQMLLDADHTAYGTIFPETGALTSSGDASAEVYAEFEYKIPENADGSLTTTNIILNSSGSIEIPAGIYDYCIANPSPGDRVWIATNTGNVGGRADDYEFQEGYEYIFTVSMHGSNDGVDLELAGENIPVVPTDVTVNPTDIEAEVSWTEGNNATEWNLRYRKYVDPINTNRTWDFEDVEQLEEWIIVDADEDGYNWGYSNNEDNVTHSGTGVLSSFSWYNQEVLNPDNWLILPKVKFGGQMTLWAAGQDPSYPAEHFAVYAAEGDWTSVDDFDAISEEFIATATMTEYTVDLSSLEGTGYIAIRHYNCSDEFRLNIDDVTVTVPDAVAIDEWTEVNGVTENPYTITDLDPDTDYEVQVQSIKAGNTSDWTASIVFKTLTRVGVETIEAATAESNVWYNLAGMRLNGKPAERGIYINNGKKVVIR